jgi:hypothetical protein
VAAARVKEFRRDNVEDFFRILENALAKVNLSLSRIYNVDETGLTIVQHKC